MDTEAVASGLPHEHDDDDTQSVIAVTLRIPVPLSLSTQRLNPMRVAEAARELASPSAMAQSVSCSTKLMRYGSSLTARYLCR